jgi:hypothetical protein
MTVFDFILDSTRKISITVPDIPDKYNYFYEPTEKLHRFDEGYARFISKDFCMELKIEIIHEIVCILEGSLKKALNGQLSLPNGVRKGEVGYALNHMLYITFNSDEAKKDRISPFWIWSGPNCVQTLMYNVKDVIYLELAPIYPWISIEQKKPDHMAYVSFHEFMKNYKPLFVEVIPRDVAIRWHKQTEHILDVMDAKD